MAPAVLCLAAGPSPASSAPGAFDHLKPIATCSQPPDERYLIADDEHGRHRLLLRGTHSGLPFVLHMPVDIAMPIRLDAAARLIRRGGRASAYQPSPLQRARLILLLGILDAEEAGLSKHEVAELLVYPRMEPLKGAAWKASAERRRTHRLSRDAERLRDRGIVDLLQARLHPPG